MPYKSVTAPVKSLNAKYHGVYIPTGAVVDIDYGPVWYGPGSSTISYNNSGKTRDNYCLHVREQLMPLATGPYTYTDPPNNSHTDDCLSGIFKVFRSATNTGPWTPAYAGFEDNLYEAWSAVRPTMSVGSLSIPNFAIELRDLRRMFQLWQKRASLRKNATGLHLNVSFGWLPFVSDVKKIYQTIHKMWKRWDNLQANALKLQTRHYAKALSATVPSEFVWANNTTVGQKEQGRTTYNWVIPPEYRLTVRYVYSIPSQPAALLRGLLDAFGISANPRIIWDALPYSFVVDWFLRVGDILDQYNHDNLKIETVIIRACHSYKSESETHVKWGLGNGALTEVWVSRKKQYIRIPCDPALATPSLQPGGFGLREGLLSASLFFNRSSPSTWSSRTKRLLRNLLRASLSSGAAFRRVKKTRRRRR